jgi:hypothetical protein
VAGLADAVALIEQEAGMAPRVVATAAGSRALADRVPLDREADRTARSSQPLLILFGTAHGLDLSSLPGVDAVLEPIRGPGAYDHLSVRTAAAIVLDRLLGARPRRA